MLHYSVEVRDLPNVKNVCFGENDIIYYHDQNNVYGESLETKNVVFEMEFVKEVLDFKITKNRLIVIFESELRVFNLSTKKEISKLPGKHHYHVDVSYQDDYVFIEHFNKGNVLPQKTLIFPDGKVKKLRVNDETRFQSNQIQNYVIFDNGYIYDKLGNQLFEHEGKTKRFGNQVISLSPVDDGSSGTQINFYSDVIKNFILIEPVYNSKVFKLHNEIIYYGESRKFYTIDLNQNESDERFEDQPEIDEENLEEITLELFDVEIPFKNKNYWIYDISNDGNWIVFSNDENDHFKVFQRKIISIVNN